MGDTVILLDENDREIAIGMVNYGDGDLKKIIGLKSSEIESCLGYKHDDEVIHRDNLVITNGIGNGEDIC